MKKYINLTVLTFLLLILSMCSEDYLDVFPEDKITSSSFWKTENDFETALNGIYAPLKDRGLYGMEAGHDGISPNGNQWTGGEKAIGNGSFTPNTSSLVKDCWVSCYKIISRANYFFEYIQKENVQISENEKAIFIGEASFLRGLAYAKIADTYGGGPIITSLISSEEARTIPRATVEETFAQAIKDYDVAIQNLEVEAPETGRATKGAAMGMKMRAYLY